MRHLGRITRSGLVHGKVRLQEAGFSIIESMISIALGMVVVLAVTTMLVRTDATQRSGRAVNDTVQGAAYAAAMLDDLLRSAGAGFSNDAARVFGCSLNARRGAANWLPRTQPWPAPFQAYPQQIRMAPVLIGKDMSDSGSDVLAVIKGNGGIAESPIEVMAVTPVTLSVRNAIGLRNLDLMLLADGDQECLLLQVAGLPAPAANTAVLNTAVTTLNLLGHGGAYAMTDGVNRTLNSFAPLTGGAILAHLGSGTQSTPRPSTAPVFTLIGVGAGNVLFGLDMLGIEDFRPMPLADGVVALHALYGVDTTGDGTLDAWVDPGVEPYTIATLSSGTEQSRQLMERIVAVRIGIVARTSRAEREAVSAGSLLLFEDLGAPLTQTVSLSAQEQRFRHRTLEVTVPIRNTLMGVAP